MGFTYRLSRRLAQAHLVLFSTLVVACNDLNAPAPDSASSIDSTSTSFTTEDGSLSQVITSNSQCSNQPAGLNLITDNAWNSKPPYTLPQGGSLDWRTYTGTAQVSITTDSYAPRSSAPIIVGRFPKGLHGGTAPFNLGIKFYGKRTLYWCVWQKLSSNFTNNGNTGTKWGFLLTPYGMGSNKINHYVNLATMLGIHLQYNGAPHKNRNLRSQYNMIANAGKWHRFEFLLIANTQGSSNGVARIWVDGAKMLDVNNVEYFLPSQSPSFVGLSWNPTYGGGSNPVPYNMWQSIDHWLISGK